MVGAAFPAENLGLCEHKNTIELEGLGTKCRVIDGIHNTGHGSDSLMTVIKSWEGGREGGRERPRKRELVRDRKRERETKRMRDRYHEFARTKRLRNSFSRAQMIITCNYILSELRIYPNLP